MILEKNIERVLISEKEIAKKVEELALQITNDYTNQEGDLVVICILRGSVIFMADLVKKIKCPLITDFLTVSSYHGGKVSSREVKMKKDLDENIMGKNVLIVEDIIDTGITLSKLQEILWTREPKSLKICTLLSKPARREMHVEVDYVGFEIPDEFVVGYGLDYNEYYRNLPYIGVMKGDK